MANTNYGASAHQYVRDGDEWVPMTQPTGGTGGTASAFGDPVPADGTAAGFADDGGNLAPANLDASGNLLVNVAAGGAGGGAVTVADGDDVAEGATTDVAALDANGTVNAHVRGIAKVLADMWDSVNHWMKVSIQNATLAVTQSGTWNITDVSGTVSLPTGASTVAKQPALGTAGTASSDVITVQGIASMTKLLVTPDSVALPANQSVNVAQINGVTPLMGAGNTGTGSPRVTIATDQAVLPVAGTGTAGTAATGVVTIQGIASMTKLLVTPDAHAVTNAGVFAVQESGTQVQADDAAFTPATSKVTMVGAEFDDAAPDSVDEGDGGAVRMSANRNLYTRIRDNAGNERGLNIDANGALAATVTNATATNLKAEVIGSGSAGTAATGVVTVQGIASMTKLLVTPDSVALPANQSVNVAQINGVTPLMGAGNTGTGSHRVTIATDQAAFTTPMPVTPTPGTTGGWSIFMASSGDGSTALTNSAQAIKASAGTLGGWYIYNPNSSATYVIIWNLGTGSITVGTTNPVMVLCIPATSAANLELTCGINFSTAISVAATTTGGGNSAPASALEANFFYK